MSNVNKPCFCGSGKKFKKCHLNSKPRNTVITYDFGKEVKIDSLLFNSLTGEMIPSFNGENIPLSSATISLQFEKPHKSKVLNQIPIPLNNFTLDPHIALEKFDLLFAVDTNTISLNNHKLSVSCVVGGFIEKKSSQPFGKFLEKITLSLNVFDKPNAIAMWNIKEKEENVGWMIFIEAIMRNPIYKEESKIGIITDSDFGNIEDFNARKLPIYDNFFLPANIQLIHATRDGGAEYFANKLIRIADSDAKKLLDEAKLLTESGTQDEFLGSQPIEGKPYTHFRQLCN